MTEIIVDLGGGIVTAIFIKNNIDIIIIVGIIISMKNKMILDHVYILPNQKRFLETESKKMDCSQAQIVREAITKYMESVNEKK